VILRGSIGIVTGIAHRASIVTATIVRSVRVEILAQV